MHGQVGARRIPDAPRRDLPAGRRPGRAGCPGISLAGVPILP